MIEHDDGIVAGLANIVDQGEVVFNARFPQVDLVISCAKRSGVEIKNDIVSVSSLEPEGVVTWAARDRVIAS